jgi:peroxiredoxin Q/BCP
MEDDMSKPQVGDQAPAFELPDTRENTIGLNDFSGKWVVLYFYPKDDTPGCTTEAIDFTAFKSQFAEHNAEILGVSPDKPASHLKFIEKHELEVTLLCDPEHKVMDAYGAWGIKKMYGKEYEGVIRSTFLIDPDGKIAAAWPKVSVKGHAEAVFAKLRELQA